jgi:hypothetical protein
VTVTFGVLAGLAFALRTGTAGGTLQEAAGGAHASARAHAPAPTPGRQVGIVVDAAGEPLVSVAVLRSDLAAVLTRTGADGAWSAPCGTDLLFAAYAPTTRDGVVRERSPGAGNYAWRRLPQNCGQQERVVLQPGGVLVGVARPGTDVRAKRIIGVTDLVSELGPVFVARVGADGSWRIDGLDTGRYLLPNGRAVDVKEGRITRVG